jgi:hypothetical protein
MRRRFHVSKFIADDSAAAWSRRDFLATTAAGLAAAPFTAAAATPGKSGGTQ